MIKINEVMDWLEEYAKKLNTNLHVYRTDEIYKGEISEEKSMYEIRRNTLTSIIIRVYTYSQERENQSVENTLDILGISFLKNETTKVTHDEREYILDSNGNIDRFNVMNTDLKESINSNESIKEKLYCLLDHHDDYFKI